MRIIAALLLAGCTATIVPDGTPITDSDERTADRAPDRAGGGGLTGYRLGRHVGLAVGFNNRRLGEGFQWTLEPAHQAAFHDDVARLQPALLRFPGGTIGQYYDWNGVMTPSRGAGTIYRAGTECPSREGIDPDATHWQPFKPLAGLPQQDDLHADTLATLAAELPQGTKVDFLLNVLTRAAGGELRLLEAASAPPYRLDVERVELGNEFYYDGASVDGKCNVFARAFPTAAHYARVADRWAQQVQASFPAANIAAVAREEFDDSSCDGASPSRGMCWNRDLLRAGLDPAVHALVVHPYVWHRGDCPSGASMYDDEDSLIGAAMQMAGKLLAPDAGEDPSRGLFDVSLGSWRGRIWITEYGYLNYGRKGTRDWSRTWAAGLGVLAYALRLTTDPRVSVLLHHNITDVVWPPFAGGRRGLTARGLALAQLDAALADARPSNEDDAWKIDFAGGPQYSVSAACGFDGRGPIEFRALVGRWFTHRYDENGARGSSGLVVNLGAREVEIDLSGFFSPRGARVDVWSACPTCEPDDGAPATHQSQAIDAAHPRVRLPARAILRFHDLGG
jgi:hypothetical protein